MSIRKKNGSTPFPAPARHSISKIFLCDLSDPALKSDVGSMEHPFFSLTTRPDMEVRTYIHGNAKITVEPGAHGRATIFDKDILIYCTSQLVNGINKGIEPSKRLSINAVDLLITTNRISDGDGYRRLKMALNRLAATRVETNIESGGELIDRGFGMIDSWEIIRKKASGRMVSLEVVLSDWFYVAALNAKVLTISRDYFRLRSPLDRRIYEIARKHCGRKNEWKISLELLYKKTDSRDKISRMRNRIIRLEEGNHLPDYSVAYDEERAQVIFRRLEDWTSNVNNGKGV